MSGYEGYHHLVTDKSQTYAWKTLFTYWTPVSAIGRLFRSNHFPRSVSGWLALSGGYLLFGRTLPSVRMRLLKSPLCVLGRRI